MCTNEPWNGLNPLSLKELSKFCSHVSLPITSQGQYCKLLDLMPQPSLKLKSHTVSAQHTLVESKLLLDFSFLLQIRLAVCGSFPFLRKMMEVDAVKEPQRQKCWKKMRTPPVNTKATWEVERALPCERTWCLRCPDEPGLLPHLPLSLTLNLPLSLFLCLSRRIRQEDDPCISFLIASAW